MKRTQRQLKLERLKGIICDKGEVRQESLFKSVRTKGFAYSRRLLDKDIEFLERTNFIQRENKLIKYIRRF